MSQDGTPGWADPDRVQRLLDAQRSIVSELSLSAVLRRIVEAAHEVAEARYAALGVLGSDGTLEQFLHVGMDADTVRAVGRLPEGRGLLGALITDPRPVRLREIGRDPRAVGFPSGHPPMTTFLGVPIRTRNAVLGNLYLTDRLDGGEFTDEDEDLMLALAASAGAAIENARLYEDAQIRQRWLQAAGEIDQVLLAAGVTEPEVLDTIAGTVQRLTEADVVMVLLPSSTTADELEVVAAVGTRSSGLVGLRCARSQSIAGRALDAQRGVRADVQGGLDDQLRAMVPLAELMALPMSGDLAARGAVVAGRTTPVPFSDAELAMAGTFASRVAIALELADARASQQRLNLLEERGRIAHELHDQVIQRLFATGLSMETVVMALPPGQLRDRTSAAVEDLDEAIGRIQATISALRDRAGASA